MVPYARTTPPHAATRFRNAAPTRRTAAATSRGAAATSRKRISGKIRQMSTFYKRSTFCSEEGGAGGDDPENA
jgi:hypothetical protein